MINRRRKEHLFVDGYNIINSWEELKKKASINLEEAREDLIELLAEYHHYSGIDITLVFDAYDVKSSLRSEEAYKGIMVVYTKERETADHYIERVLEREGKIRRIRVATSDRLEQEMILARGGTRLSAKELEAEILNARLTANRKRKTLIRINKTYLEKLDEKNISKLEEWKRKDKS